MAKLIKRKSTELTLVDRAFSENDYDIILKNNMIDICVDACSVCWDKPVEEDFEKRQRYISARVKTGHESVIEHSNLVLLIKVRKEYIDDLLEVVSCCRYLETDYEKYKGSYYLLIGGSIRGYKHIFRTIENLNNRVLGIISRAIRENVSYGFFDDFIKDGLFDRYSFIDLVENDTESHPIKSESKLIEVVNVDKISDDKYRLLKRIGFDDQKIFGLESTTVLFKDLSRVGSHQLVRHRNGVTQESQRYVDYRSASFTSPDTFKPEKYDSNTKYHIEAFNKDLTMNELGTLLCSVYGDLRDQGVDKEDARGFLPFNVKCPKLYMTFNYRTLAKFFDLRTDKHAQAEIRSYAVDLFNIMIEHGSFDGNHMKHLFIPYYINNTETADYSGIDEVIK